MERSVIRVSCPMTRPPITLRPIGQCSTLNKHCGYTAPGHTVVPMADASLLDAIANPFIESASRDGFNGVTASTLLRLQANPERLRADLSGLIQNGQITAV